MPSKILVPTDFSRCSEAAVEHAADLAKQGDAELILFHVRDASLFVAPDGLGYAPANIYGEEAPQVQERLTWRAEHLRQRGVKVRTIQDSGVPREQILQLAEKEHVDLIVMGTHGRGLLGRVFLGSVADGISRTAKVPVVTVREPADEQTSLPDAR